jgi:hypothetical protein
MVWTANVTGACGAGPVGILLADYTRTAFHDPWRLFRLDLVYRNEATPFFNQREGK